MSMFDKPLTDLSADTDEVDDGFKAPPIPSLSQPDAPFTIRHTGGPVQLPIAPKPAAPIDSAAAPTMVAPEKKDPEQTEPSRPELSRPELSTPEPASTFHSMTALRAPESNGIEPMKGEPVKPEPVQAEHEITESDESETVDAEPMKPAAAVSTDVKDDIEPDTKADTHAEIKADSDKDEPAIALPVPPAPPSLTLVDSSAAPAATTPKAPSLDPPVKLSLSPPISPAAPAASAAPTLAPSLSASTQELTLDGLVSFGAGQNASDLFLKVGSPPALKRHGFIVPTDFPPLTEADMRRLAYEHMTPEQQAQFEKDHEMNLSFTVSEVARVRQNVYWQRNTIATTCRMIPLRVKSLQELQIDSKAIVKFTEEHNGLVLVTGPTGSGKTTTLAAMIDHMNENRHLNIITIEDPIEYVHPDKKAILSQREVGIDTASFNEALRQVLRQTPDVILIGELRDLDTVNVALQAAETGHLVFATLHTASAAETLDRISNMYQPHERAMLWLRLSVCMRGVISQKLLRRADGSGRIGAMEIMVATPSISKQLEEGRSEDMYATIRQDGDEKFWGMQTMNQCLDRYFAEGIITEEEALLNAGNLAELKQMLRRTAADPATKKAA